MREGGKKELQFRHRILFFFWESDYSYVVTIENSKLEGLFFPEETLLMLLQQSAPIYNYTNTQQGTKYQLSFL